LKPTQLSNTRSEHRQRKATPTPTRTRFDWSDPLLLDQQLTEDERMVRDAAREYCAGKLAPRVLEAFRTEQTDVAIFRELGALDMLGIVIPEQYGGSFSDVVTYGLICEELARVDWVVASVVSVANSLCASSILRSGTDAQKERWLPGIAAGEIICSACLTEPGGGTD